MLSLKSDGMSGQTIAKLKSLLGRALGSAVDNGVLANNPVIGIRISGTSKSSDRFALRPDEVDALVAALPEHYRPLTILLADCGLRPGEALGLRQKHLLDGGRLAINSALVESHGRLIEGPTKTRRTRIVPMTLRAQDAVRVALGDRADDPDGRVFVTESGTDIHLSNYRRMLRRAAPIAGVPASITPYVFRHTCATLLARSDVPTATAAKVLGHDPTVFLRVYAHVYDEDLELVAAAIEHATQGQKLAEP